jgi:predicted nicotinamide N-methyase
MPSSIPRLAYRLKTEQLKLQNDCLSITSLADLNETIDQLFVELEKTGNTSLLEELCPYFGCIWPSARALCNYLEFSSVRAQIKNSSVLEIGCGLALPSLLCAKLGARVTATDFHPEVPEFLAINREQNQISNLDYRRLDWRNGGNELGYFDWILGSDVLYEKEHSLILARAISNHLSPHGRAVITDPARPYLQTFVDAMKSQGFDSRTTVQNIPDTPQNKEIFLIEFSRVSNAGPFGHFP